MRNKGFIILFGLLLSVGLLNAQMELVFKNKMAAKARNFRVDALGYPVWFEKDVIYKMDTTGQLLFQQSLKAYGHISDMDLISPMKYLVFFEQQQVIGFFDNTFTPYQGRTRLSDLDVSYATLVCYSMQFDRFWVFDQDNSKLILFNSQGRRTAETENLNGLVGLQNPVQMLERNGNLYVVDEDRGVYIFDMFGALINFVEIPQIQWIQVDKKNFYFVKEEKFALYNFKTKSFFEMPLSGSFETHFQLFKKKVHLLTDKFLHIFDLK